MNKKILLTVTPLIIGEIFSNSCYTVSASNFNAHSSSKICQTEQNQWPALHLEVFHQNINNVKRFLENEKFGELKNINTKVKAGLTPLHIASLLGNKNILNLLLNKGANPNIPDNDGSTPLHIALQENKLELVPILLLNGANPNFYNNNKVYPIHLSILTKNYPIISVLIKKGANISAEDLEGKTPIHIACEIGDNKGITLLLNNGANIESRDISRNTPLHTAAQYDQINTVKFLLSKDANINALNIMEVPPVYYALLNNNPHIMKLFFEKGADINFKFENGLPLHFLAKTGNLGIMNILLSRKINVNVLDHENNTPLHIAVLHGNMSIVKTLVTHGALINPRNNSSLTPLHIALNTKRTDIVQFLMQKGGNINSNDSIKKPLSQEMNFFVLIEQGKVDEISATSRINIGKLLSARNNLGQLTLHYAVKHKQIGITSFLLSKIHKIRVKQYINSKDRFGFSPIFYAQTKEMWNLLKQNGATVPNVDVSFIDSDGWNPLHHALANNEGIFSIKNIVWHGINVNSTDNFLSTPLHIVAYTNNIHALHFLVSEGAKIDSVDRAGKKPIFYANTGAMRNAILTYELKSHNNAQRNAPVNIESNTPRRHHSHRTSSQSTDQPVTETKPRNTPSKQIQYNVVSEGTVSIEPNINTNKNNDSTSDKQPPEEKTLLNAPVNIESNTPRRHHSHRTSSQSTDQPVTEAEPRNTPSKQIQYNVVSVGTVNIEPNINTNKDNDSTSDEQPPEEKILPIEEEEEEEDIYEEEYNEALIEEFNNLKMELENTMEETEKLRERNKYLKNKVKKSFASAMRHGNEGSDLSQFDDAENSGDFSGVERLFEALSSGVHDSDIQEDQDMDIEETIDEINSSDPGTLMQGLFSVLLQSGSTPIMEDMISNGDLNLDVLDERGFPFMKHLIDDGNLDHVNFMVSHGANLNLTFLVEERNSRRSLLMHAIDKNQTKIALLLLKNGADINFKDDFGWTAVHFACFKGNYDILIHLISMDANLNLKDQMGRTPIQVASSEGHKKIIIPLILLGANIDEQDDLGNSPLHNAITSGHVEIVQLLISKKAFVNVSNNDGHTPLDVAIFENQREIADILRENGAITTNPMFSLSSSGSFYSQSYTYPASSISDFSWLSIISSLDDSTLTLGSARKITEHTGLSDLINSSGISSDFLTGSSQEIPPLTGLIEFVESSEMSFDFPAENPKNPPKLSKLSDFAESSEMSFDFPAENPKNPHKLSKLSDFAESSGMSLDFLAENPKNPSKHIKLSDFAESSGMSLDFLAENPKNPPKHIKLSDFAESSETIQPINVDEPRQYNDLHYLVMGNDVRSTIDLLGHVEDVNARDLTEEGQTALHFAAQNGNPEMIRLLISRGASPLVTNNFGKLPIEYSKDPDTQKLFEKIMSIHQPQHLGKFALHMAIESGSKDEVLDLISLRADVNRHDNLGFSPIHVAINHILGSKTEEEHAIRFEILDILLQNGANINAPNAIGATLIYTSIQNRNVGMLRILLNHGADVNTQIIAKDGRFTFPIHMSVEAGSLEMTDLLFPHSADINFLNSEGSTPVCLAAQLNKTEMIGFLTSRNADLNVSDKSGMYPIHYATARRNLKAVSILLSSGANPNFRNNSKYTPLHLAISQNLVEIASTLLEHGADINEIDFANGPFTLDTFSPDMMKLLRKHGAIL